MPRAVPSENNKPRRDEILDQATRLFAERGYEGTSMADLAERVGMRKASLFYHFASKDVLYEAVIERLINAMGEAMRRVAVNEGTFLERLDTLSDATVMVLAEQPYAARLLVREAMEWGPVIRHKLIDSIMSVLSVTEEFAESGKKAGVFVDQDIKQVILSVIGMQFLPFTVSSFVQHLSGKDAFDPEFIEQRKKCAREHMRALLLTTRQLEKERNAPSAARESLPTPVPPLA